jgi:hypothetical protein
VRQDPELISPKAGNEIFKTSQLFDYNQIDDTNGNQPKLEKETEEGGLYSQLLDSSEN